MIYPADLEGEIPAKFGRFEQQASLCDVALRLRSARVPPTFIRAHARLRPLSALFFGGFFRVF